MTITNSTDVTDILVNSNSVGLQGLLDRWECNEIYLFDLMPCHARTIYLWFYLTQDSEEDFDLNYIKSPGELGLYPGDLGYDETLLHWKKFNDWPSWRYMKDKATFDIEFDLWLEDTPGGIVSPS